MDKLSMVLQKLPKIRSRWPTEALLTKITYFNLYDGDKVIGIVTLNPGTKVKIVEIKQEHAIVRVGSNQSPLPIANMDIIDRMGGADRILSYPDDEVSEQKKPPTKSDSAEK